MTPEQAVMVLQNQADIIEWLAQITTHLYWINVVILPLIAFSMIYWFVLKQYMH